MLTTNSYSIGCSIGKSAGLDPSLSYRRNCQRSDRHPRCCVHMTEAAVIDAVPLPVHCRQACPCGEVTRHVTALAQPLLECIDIVLGWRDDAKEADLQHWPGSLCVQRGGGERTDKRDDNVRRSITELPRRREEAQQSYAYSGNIERANERPLLAGSGPHAGYALWPPTSSARLHRSLYCESPMSGTCIRWTWKRLQCSTSLNEN